MLDKYYERQLNYKKQLAIKVAKTPFAVCRLREFSKKEALGLEFFERDNKECDL